MKRHTDRLDERGVRDLLRDAVAAAGGMQIWADEHEISISYVSDVLHGRRRPGPTIYTALGFEKRVEYVRVKDGAQVAG